MVSAPGRPYRRRMLRFLTVRTLLFVLLIVSFLEAWRIHSNIVNIELEQRSKRANRPGEKIYIASMHINDASLLHEHWMGALLDLVETLGKDNVFVSIYESGSRDKTKSMLQGLESTLHERDIPGNVVMSKDSHSAEVAKGTAEKDGYIYTSRGKWEPRRIPFLSKLRNKTMKDLIDLEKRGLHFDKVLFLNDVVFNAEDVLRLINTNAGDYAAACSIDFAAPPKFYDTFALRDTEGHPHATQTWPYFRSRTSRQALISHTDAVPVKSCWNGITVMAAEPFVLSSEIKFRGVPDSLAKYHLEGSECCLIHADNPLSDSRGVFLNPRARVGYSTAAYEAVNPQDGRWVSLWSVFSGLWANRLRRWTAFHSNQWTLERRLQAWSREDANNTEPGLFCLIDEMQVIVAKGWEHV